MVPFPGELRPGTPGSELSDECSEMRRDARRKRVILISQGLSDRGGKPNVSVAAGIRVTREQRIAWDDTSTNPIINSISCGAHDYSAP
jgi:glycerol kinase